MSMLAELRKLAKSNAIPIREHRDYTMPRYGTTFEKNIASLISSHMSGSLGDVHVDARLNGPGIIGLAPRHRGPSAAPTMSAYDAIMSERGGLDLTPQDTFLSRIRGGSRGDLGRLALEYGIPLGGNWLLNLGASSGFGPGLVDPKVYGTVGVTW